MSKRMDEYLENFFDEKDLFKKIHTIEHNGYNHMVESETVIRLIKQSPYNEKQKIINTLRELDFKNGDISHYIRFLAEAYIKTNY